MPVGHFAWKAGSRFSRYEIQGRLSAGGMAEVWRARVLGVEGFQKEIVIKTMRPELADSPDLVRMFINEAEIAARMNHPGMVQVFDFGQFDGRYFIAMEYVPGRSLRQLGRSLRLKQRRLPRAFVLRTILDVVRALGYGHGLMEKGELVGFVHRDVSPENVMVSHAGATKLIDFGAAATSARPPPSSSVVGKLRYLSPERLRGNVGDARSDIYSVGVMLYEYLTGVSPFDGQDMVKKIIEGQAPDIASKVNVPLTVARVVRRAMAADLRKRYGGADRLADELLALLAGDLGHDPYGASESDVLELLHKAAATQQEGPVSGDVATPKLRVLPPLSSRAARPSGDIATANPSTETTAEAAASVVTPPPTPAMRAPFVRLEPRLEPRPEPRPDTRAESRPDPRASQLTPPPDTRAESRPDPRASQLTPPPIAKTPAPRLSGFGGTPAPVSRGAGSTPPIRRLTPSPVAVPASGDPVAEPRGGAPASALAAPGGRAAAASDQPAAAASDPFAVVRRAGVNPVAAWFRDVRPEAGLAEVGDAPVSDDEAVAAACFERGLALVSEHRLQDAVVYWERAAALAPARRSYQANLRRLVAQIRDTKDEGDQPTPRPQRNLIRD